MAAADVYRREIGALSTRTFTSRLAYSKDHMLRLDLSRKLEKHVGSVTSVCFNAGGDTLVTGSSDTKLIVWDWESGDVKLSILSVHSERINQAKFMPFSGDRSIVTCGAEGMVRHAQIVEGGNVKSMFLTHHRGQAHNLAIEPGSPHIFYTCGDDGMVQHVDLRRRPAATKLFVCRSMFTTSLKSVNCLTEIAIDPRNPYLFAIGGGDALARVYDIRKYNRKGSNGLAFINSFRPSQLSHFSGISGLAFSDESELLVSYIGEPMYLFSKDMGMGANPAPARARTSTTPSHDSVAEGPTVFKGHINMLRISGVNFLGPKCEYVASRSDCGRIFIWKKKNGELVRVMDASSDVVNCIEAHPHIPALVCGTDADLKIWTPKATERATLSTNID